jgi:hypothetical protein
MQPPSPTLANPNALHCEFKSNQPQGRPITLGPATKLWNTFPDA